MKKEHDRPLWDAGMIGQDMTKSHDTGNTDSELSTMGLDISRLRKCISRPTAEGAIVVDPISGECFSLNKTAIFIWDIVVSEKPTESSVTQSLERAFSLSPETSDLVVASWVDTMKQLGYSCR